ncbi:hypothetical protein HPO96_18900 [Kribbella sandramycini]|uniref:Uncharacterized protein n=1 Tax=Kribbella sandramycini TaxID=60450 RepID=A0A7Y4P1P2_9ACTN|nr:hypothetical protein [Kribbella sandramycini]MBB6564616.1 hypothetical protein [Kribbella sandramycini]NOL42320.1 hypothetical protein [Kribbella sandramycini]
MTDRSLKDQAWELFDEIVAQAAFRDVTPWRQLRDGLRYEPDYDTLCRLLGVPLFLTASSQSGVPAIALDVWTSYELRRAGFDSDRVWPRPSAPRVLPRDVAMFVDSLPKGLRDQVWDRLARGQSGGTASASANLLGKNYVKQVDVVMSAWQTGPELMISTKRMDSSFGKNAANRVEESYGDAKNLSLRHPRSALGFLYSLRSTAFATERDTADGLVDLLTKLGREDDAYDAVGLVVPEWGGVPSAADDSGEAEEAAPIAVDPVMDPVVSDVATAADGGSGIEDDLEVAAVIEQLPEVTLRHDFVPYELSPGRFFEVMVKTVLDNSPIKFHKEARVKMRAAEGQ